MSTSDLEQLARETAARIEQAQRNYLNAYPSEATPVDLVAIVLSALRTARSATANEDTARLDELCALLAGAWLYGGWKPETCAEGEMQTILRNRGWWPITEKQLVEKRAAIDQARGEGK